MKQIISAVVWSAFILSAVSMLITGSIWHVTARDNDLIADLMAGEDVSAASVNAAAAEVRLARAAYLVKQHKPDEALATLSAILSQGDNRLQALIRYNLGNLYLSQAIAEVEGNRLDEARTAVTLAKQAYKQALNKDSQFWDAKFNLETAMRLLPDFDRINVEDEGGQPPKNPLWTTVPGFPRGLP